MKLKLDLHPIYSDSRKIVQGLIDIIAQAVEIRASEVEIIPGKGSGALKKTVLRFLERPEIKSQYHRIEKDDENFGRIFVHFRFHPDKRGQSGGNAKEEYAGQCFFCPCEVKAVFDEAPMPGERLSAVVECPSCGSPNKVIVGLRGVSSVNVEIESGYEDQV
jgi:hypothetical protein